MGDEPTLPYVKTSQTSADAALRAEPRAGTDRATILLRFQRWAESGWTDEELATVLDMNPSTLRPRRIELLRQGWIKDSGRTRRTRSGRKAVVWVAT